MRFVLLSGDLAAGRWALPAGASWDGVRGIAGLSDSFSQSATLVVPEGFPESGQGILSEGAQELVVAPAGLGTAGAALLACAHLAGEQNASPNETVVATLVDPNAGVVPAGDLTSIDGIVQSRLADLLLVGTEPEDAAGKYDYIVPRKRRGMAWPVSAFKGMASPAEAGELVDQGALWSCGVYAFMLGYMLDLLDTMLGTHVYPEVLDRCRELPKGGFDCVIAEHAASMVVLPYSS